MKRHLTFIFALFVYSCASYSFAAATLSTNLYFGINNPDVQTLQRILNSNPNTTVATSGPGSSGEETTYFGPATLQAVNRFQLSHSAEILAPLGLSAPTGFVGPSTRQIINTLANTLPAQSSSATSQPNQIATSTAPVALSITSISPSPFNDGGVINITGTGFTASNTVMILGVNPGKYTGVASSYSGTQISLTISTGMGDNINANLANIDSRYREAVIQKLINGFRSSNGQATSSARNMLVPVTVQVKNEHGTSSPASIMINILKM